MTATLSITDLDRFIDKNDAPVPRGYPENMRRFYSPYDDVHGALKAVIAPARHSLVIAMYGFDDNELAAIIDDHLKNPNLFVQISLDKSQAGGVHERDLLAQYHAEYDSNRVAIGTSEKSAIMHRKMAIVDGIWSIGGSTNWSTGGESKQDNELTIVYDAHVCARDRTMLDLEHEKMQKQMGRVAA